MLISLISVDRNGQEKKHGVRWRHASETDGTNIRDLSGFPLTFSGAPWWHELPHTRSAEAWCGVCVLFFRRTVGSDSCRRFYSWIFRFVSFVADLWLMFWLDNCVSVFMVISVTQHCLFVPSATVCVCVCRFTASFHQNVHSVMNHNQQLAESVW